MKSRSTKTLIIALAVLLVGAGAVAVSQTVKRVHARGEFGFGGQEHFYLETHAAWAEGDDEGGAAEVTGGCGGGPGNGRPRHVT